MRVKSLLTFGLVRCCSLLSSLSLCKRSNSSLISAAVLFRSTTCSKEMKTKQLPDRGCSEHCSARGFEALACCPGCWKLSCTSFNSQNLELSTWARSKARHERKPHALIEGKMFFFYFHSLDKIRAKSFPTTTTRHCSAVVTISDPLTALPGVDTKMEITESLWLEVNWCCKSCVILGYAGSQLFTWRGSGNEGFTQAQFWNG